MENIIVAILGSSAFTVIVSAVCGAITGRKKMKNGMKLLLLSSLKRDARDIIASGRLDQTDYTAFMSTYEAYKSLGGDGWADIAKQQIEAMKVNLEQ